MDNWEMRNSEQRILNNSSEIAFPLSRDRQYLAMTNNQQSTTIQQTSNNGNRSTEIEHRLTKLLFFSIKIGLPLPAVWNITHWI